MMKSSLVVPKSIKAGDNIGICTPSIPGYALSNEVFENGLRNLEKEGFKYKLGLVTKNRSTQGYRSASPQDRAEELMELFCDPEVDGIITTIGGMNSNSLIPYIDFEKIKHNPKVFCGYSDITSLHLALMKYANLATFYGPGLMPHWCEYPDAVEESVGSFLASMNSSTREIRPFSKWSNHFRDWKSDAWKKEAREWQENAGWKVLNQGEVEAEIVVSNLNTLMSSAGTPYFPDLEGRVLLIEEMYAPMSRQERSLMQLRLMGVFDKISGLIFGKPEQLVLEEAPFGFEELILEVVGERGYPIISNFDCSHTIPMHTIRQHSIISFKADKDFLEYIEVK